MARPADNRALGDEDPSHAEGREFERAAAFARTADYLANRISAVTSLPLASIDRMALGAKLK